MLNAFFIVLNFFVQQDQDQSEQQPDEETHQSLYPQGLMVEFEVLVTRKATNSTLVFTCMTSAIFFLSFLI